MEEKQEQKFQQMTETPVGRLICHLALPCIISMLVTAFYNMADTFFVGMLQSNSATAAVGVVFSLMAVLQAIGFFFGHGSGNFISRELGRHHYEEASNMAATGFFSALFSGLVLCILGQIFLEPLAYLLGSTDTILPYSTAYLRVILLGAPWMTASLVLNNQLRFQGSAVYGMVGITSGAALNIALDPLLIFVFDMGVAGAAWATIFSQFVSFCLLLVGCTRGGNLQIHVSRVQLKWDYFSMIIRGGLPSLARQGLASFCVKSSTVFLLVVSTLGFAFAPQLIALFRDDPEVVAIGAVALRCQCVTFCAMGWVTMSNMMLQTIGQTVPATFLAMARQGIFFVPLVWILPLFLGLTGVQITQSASDLLTLACAIPIQLSALRKLSLPDHTPIQNDI